MSKNIFIPSTRKNSRGEATQEDVEFVIWKNPNTGEEYKLLNLENDKYAPRTGLIELKPVKVDKRHENSVGMRLIYDKATGCHVGIPVRFDPKTNAALWQKVTISNSETYDLSIPDQRMQWIMVKHSPYFTDPDENGIERNVNFNSDMKARYKAIDREREALIFAKTLTLKNKAESIAQALDQDLAQLEEVGLMCGFDPKALSSMRLWMEVCKFAEKKPEEFLKIYKSEMRTELATLRRAIQCGVVNHSLAKGYMYSGQSLGYSEPDALLFLKDHPNVLAAIDAVSRKRDSETLETKSIPKNTVTEENAKELIYQQKIKELEAQLAAKNSETLGQVADSILENEDPEFAQLLKKAKALDVKGAHKIKDKEKLRQRIKEKEKLKAS